MIFEDDYNDVGVSVSVSGRYVRLTLADETQLTVELAERDVLDLIGALTEAAGETR